jgi:hypothetical protein
MRAVGGAFAPLILAICLPILESQAMAAEAATGHDAWNVIVEPGVSNAGLLKRLALQDADPAVPPPVEPGDAVPADEFALPEVVPGNVSQDAETHAAEETGVVITPGDAVVESAAAESGVGADAEPVQRGDYWTIYKSIPFLRSQYEVNPSYRHDATMELLTGNARPTVIHEHDGNCAPAGPALGAIPPYITDIYLGQIPTFVQRYLPPAIPFGYPLVW